ncbi:cytochrome C oxidase subunit IV family protein [Microvirga guangxiensis]|uniref:Cytochrome C oxidase subunit IV n=1 Tax=Microvirga guangxiensis TaxID=549386 RepID=A0A1G5LLG7_9HYPH|nr:cytochrome C oxidase subunit IV family protein [Microvirga guangxiensis]SCZ13755.1 Cytochrome C oxidase subunit IV [Microvirga guangxiensis]
MRQTNARRITRAWGLLVLLTLLSLGAGHSGWTGLTANTLILAAAFAKGRWMMMDFLKLRDASAGWQVLFLCWLALVTIIPWATATLPLLLG